MTETMLEFLDLNLMSERPRVGFSFKDPATPEE